MTRMCVQRHQTGDGVRPGSARTQRQSSAAGRACRQRVSCIVRTPRQSARADATPELAGGARPGAGRTSRQSARADATTELADSAGRRNERACRWRWKTPRQSAWANATGELADVLADATAERAGGVGASVHGQRNEWVGGDALPEREQPLELHRVRCGGCRRHAPDAVRRLLSPCRTT
jgi:hypothetical protein